MTDDIKLPELPEIRLPISKDDWYSHIEMLMHDYAREAVRMNAQVQRPVPTSERLPTAADADVTESVWLFNKMVSKWYLYHWRDVETAYISHWQPTGLVRPAEVKP